jgi:hypothetical protein
MAGPDAAPGPPPVASFYKYSSLKEKFHLLHSVFALAWIFSSLLL